MIHECVVRCLASGEVAITAESTQSPPVRTGTVLLEVDRSVVDGRHLGRVLSSEQFEQDGKRLGWCSLTGRVAQVGDDVHKLQVGDCVSAIGPVADCVVVSAQECLLVPDGVDADQAAYWALLVALVRSLRRLRIEIGESVLVLGGGMVGNLVAQLSLVAGAALVAGVDFNRGSDGKEFKVYEAEPTPIWVIDQDSLQEALPDGKGVDALIDAWGDLEQLGRMLPVVRTGGRALLLAVNGAGCVDFDFYPDIHRRSLRLVSGTLRGALQQNGWGKNHLNREAALIAHLWQSDRLELLHQVATCVDPVHSARQVALMPIGPDLSIRW